MDSHPPSKRSRVIGLMGSIHQNVDNDRVVRARKVRFIPHDIIINILSRLPGSTLGRFRLVCKLWFSLTHDAGFIDSHLEYSSKVDPPHIIIFFYEERCHCLLTNHLTALDETWKPMFRVSDGWAGRLCTPPCNGLICVYDDYRDVRLWNPMTREILSLPRPHDSKGLLTYYGKVMCSFGFHPVTKEYKVVSFLYHRLNHKPETYYLGCEVFTLGSSSWKYIGGIHSYLNVDGININGSIYWTTGANRMIPDSIIGLDLKNEKFRTILCPEFKTEELFRGSVFLVQLEGKLCLVHAACQEPGDMNIWTLEDHTNSIWVHKYCLPILMFHSGHPTEHRQRWHPEPIIIHRDRILLKLFDILSYCDLQTHTTEQVYYDRCLSSYYSKVYAYVGTIVSLRNLAGL